MVRRDGGRSSLGVGPVPLLLLLLLAGPLLPAGGAASVATWEAELDHWVPPLMRAAAVPGLEIAVVQDGAVVLHRAYGVGERGEEAPLSEDGVFEAASLSKPLFSYAVLRLVEQKKLDLDASLAGFLEEPFMDDERLPEVTARMVLSHMTGFPNWRPQRWTDEPGTLEFETPPGEEWGYSGEGFIYLQQVVEAITGQPAAAYLRETLLEPLGMRRSSYAWEDRFAEPRVRGHDTEGVPEEDRWEEGEALVAGSLETTAMDYARFLIAMLDRSEPEEFELLPSSIEEMLTPQAEVDPGIAWGLGWGLEEERGIFWHWGDNEVWKAFTMGSRESGMGIVILTNGANGLQVIRPIVGLVFPGEHPSLDFRLLEYNYRE